MLFLNSNHAKTYGSQSLRPKVREKQGNTEIHFHFFGDFSVIKSRKLVDVKPSCSTRSWMQDLELTTATVNQDCLASSVSRSVAYAILMHQNGRFSGKDELTCQYPHSIKPLLMSAEPSLQNMYGNMSKKY